MPITRGHGPGVVHVAGLLAPLMLGLNPPSVVGGSQSTYGIHAQALYNAEAIKTQVFKSISGAQGPTVRSFVSQPPQQDFTQQSQISPAVRTPPAQVSTTLGTFINVLQQVDLTQRSQFYSAAANPGGWISTRISAGPDPTEYVQFRSAFFATVRAPLAPQPSPIKHIVSVPPPADLTQQSVITQAIRTQPISGSTVRPNALVPGQIDLTVNGTRIWTPSTFFTPPAPPPSNLVSNPCLQVYLQPRLFAASLPGRPFACYLSPRQFTIRWIC